MTILNRFNSRRKSIIPVALLILSILACNVPDTETPAGDTGPVSSPTAVAVPTPFTDQTDPASRPTDLTTEQIDRIARASVQIIAAQQRGNSLEPIWTGSGTLINNTGEILTNCHVACGAPFLIIALTESPDQPPVESYLADIVHFDEELDLALLQITRDINGNPTSPSGLPFIEVGDSNSLRLGEPIRIFGYPGVGGETITYTSGSVSGFESASGERVIIKTDANIASGNSGGTAVDLFGRLIGVPTWVNPDVRDGVTIGGIGVLRPINLITRVRQNEGAPPAIAEAGLPPAEDPDPFEPNNDLNVATGPLSPSDVVSAYISWQDDIDVFYFDATTTRQITVGLSNIPGGTDYDLYLLNENADIIGSSENETGNEQIQHTPPTSGRYYVAVVAYSGASSSSPYTLSVSFDGGGSSGSSGGGSGGSSASGSVIRVTGQVIDGNTSRPLAGGVIGLLGPGISCSRFFNLKEPDMSLVITLTETDSRGNFTLDNVPVGAQYPTFFIFGGDHVCEDNWLDVPGNADDTDLGPIEIAF